MRRRLVTLATTVIVALALAVPAGAADLHEAHVGTMCSDGFVELHFVQNQTDGSAGDLTVVFDTGTVTASPSKVTPGTTHWTIAASESDTLEGASTETDGKLVLSDFQCGEGKKSKGK